MVIIVFGLPGSGKSYLASHLASRLDAVYLNSDEVRLTLFPVRTYSDEEKKQVYRVILNQARLELSKGRDVVLDGTFYKSKIRNEFSTALHAFSPCFIEVIADESLILQRLKRPRKFSEADASVFALIKTQWEPMQDDHLILTSTDSNLEEMIHQALAYIHPLRHQTKDS
ncbi:MAG: ATP-binding protein [Cyclobacteriaceae bacterium]|jgi:predicted kinase|nr:ATP-binding protein [Cyclobacteriaceae bacterium]